MSMYERFTFRGKTMDRMTIGALLCTEKVLGYELTIIQGSYNRGVSQSAGTHDGGGACDLVWFDIKRKNRALRGVGKFAGWPRETLPGEWAAHWHGILIGNEKASPSAKDQVVDYRNGRNGLANGARDTWWRPRKIVAFNWRRKAPISWKRVNGISTHKRGVAFTTEGARQVEVVARALRGFGFDLVGHRKGRMDGAMTEALRKFKRIRKIDADVDAPLNPKTAYALCIPTREDD